MKGWPGRAGGHAVLRRALRPLRFRFDRSPRCVAGARGTVSWVRACGWTSDATHSRVAVAGQLPPGRRGGYAAAGWVGGLVAVQSCAGRPPVGIWVAVTRPAACRAWRAWSIWPAGWLWLSAWLIWLRVSPPGC